MNSASYWADQPASAAWALPEPVFTWLSHRLGPSSIVLELGSGIGTARLAEMCGTIHSVEHDPKYVGLCPASNYIHAPLVDRWYDPEVLRASLPPHYDCVVVDGPPAAVSRRSTLLEYLDLFIDAPMLFDDVHRNDERELAMAVASRRNQSISLHVQTDGRAFATVGWRMP